MCAVRDAGRPGRACACASSACPTRSPRTSTTARPTSSCARAAAATSRSPASRPTCTSASRPRACSPCRSRCAARAAHGSTPWLGDNAVLKAIDVFRAHRVAALRARVLRAVRPPLDQPRPHPRRRRAQQGARPLRRWTSTSATCPARTRARSSPRSAALADVEVVATLHRARRRSSSRTNPYVRALRDAVGARHRGRGAERRARRRLRRHLVPRGGHPGGRVRPGRRAATTAPRSGCRSPRCSATAQALTDFVRALPAALERDGDRRADLRPSRAGCA